MRKLQANLPCPSICSPQKIAPDRKSCEGDEEEENEGTRRLFSFALQNPMEIVAQEKDAQDRPQEEDGFIRMEGGSEVAFGEREHQARDAAARAVESRRGMEGAGQAESRRAAEDEVGDADGEEQGVAFGDRFGTRFSVGFLWGGALFRITALAFGGKKESSGRGRLLSFLVVHDSEVLDCAAIVFDDLVEGALDQGVADDSAAEESEDEIDDGEVRVRRHAAFLLRHDNGLTHLVKPIETVDAAADEDEEDGHAARGRRAFARCRMGILGERVNPINAVKTAGDEGENNGERDAFLCHENLPFCCEGRRWPTLLWIS